MSVTSQALPGAVAGSDLRSPRVGAVALASVVVSFVALVLLLSTQSPHGSADAARVALGDVHDHAGALWVAAALRSLALVATALTCLHLAGRRTLASVGPAALIVALAVSQWVMVDAAQTFADGAVRTEAHAQHLLADTAAQRAASIGTTIAALVFAYTVASAAMAAAQVGLTTRFLGYFGVGAAVASALIPIAGQGMMAGWMGSVGAVLLGWWRGGQGPAWDDAPGGSPEKTAPEARR